MLIGETVDELTVSRVVSERNTSTMERGRRGSTQVGSTAPHLAW